MCCSAAPLGELSKLLWGWAVAWGHLLVNMRRAEKPPSGKAAEVVPGGFVAGWNTAEIGVGPGLGRVGPSGFCILLVRTDWRL